jgi:hypothetical protein
MNLTENYKEPAFLYKRGFKKVAPYSTDSVRWIYFVKTGMDHENNTQKSLWLRYELVISDDSYGDIEDNFEYCYNDSFLRINRGHYSDEEDEAYAEDYDCDQDFQIDQSSKIELCIHTFNDLKNAEYLIF